MRGTNGIDAHGVLWVDTIAAKPPSVIFSKASFGVAFTLPWCATFRNRTRGRI